MKRAQATAALEAATNERFSRIFGILCMSLSGVADNTETVKRFDAGWAVLLKAHSLAESVIERSIPQDKIDSDA